VNKKPGRGRCCLAAWSVEQYGETRRILQSKIQKFVFVSLLNALALSMSCTLSAKPDKKSTLISLGWRSNAAYSKLLAPPVSVNGYYVRPPLGFTFQKKQILSDAKIGYQCDWHGPTRADGTRPRFVLAVFNLRPGAVSQEDAEASLNSGLDAMNTDVKHYVHTDPEHGKANGMGFVRAYWKRDPNDPDDGKRFHGFQYEYVQGATSIVIIGSDVEPHDRSTLDLLEAAALTFHK